MEQTGPTEQLLDMPKTAFVAQFLGNPPANLLSVQKRNGIWHAGDIPLQMHGLPVGLESLKVMIKPHRWTIAAKAGEGALPCRLLEALPFGSEVLLQLESHGGRLAALVPAGINGRPGQQIFVTPPHRPCAVFDQSGVRVP